MGETMVRKQVYLRHEQDRKLKKLAARRGCTEAEVMREALDRLTDPEEDALAQLEADGLLVSVDLDPTLPRGKAAKALREDFERWLDSKSELDIARNLRLSEAVLEDRGPR